MADDHVTRDRGAFKHMLVERARKVGFIEDDLASTISNAVDQQLDAPPPGT